MISFLGHLQFEHVLSRQLMFVLLHIYGGDSIFNIHPPIELLLCPPTFVLTTVLFSCCSSTESY